ncbi:MULTISPECIES: OmpA family protein [unclassified Meridianimarinicoccus]|uniref:OmpA family protein n=1 Tax=unclassified Meridianimarinicoccus TaxID=2923344 RepID=UPI0018661BDA|nr:OmpA family protein [Fluviibacterium sp. MJW13]
MFPTRIPTAAKGAGLLALALALTACTPTYEQGTGSGNRNTTTGAIIGGVAGGLLAGPVTGGNGGKAAVGAVAGAAVGAAIGSALDRQAAELDQQLGDSITVENQGDKLLVNFPQDILFAVDSASVAESQKAELRTLAANLQRYPDTTVQIIGHTDNTGAASYNFDLSARRAGAVSSVLVGAGVAGKRLSAIGRGEDAPIASNLSVEGRAQNRRVEVVIRPNG